MSRFMRNLLLQPSKEDIRNIPLLHSAHPVVLVNQELLLAFTARKNNWIKRQRLDLKNKQEMEKQKLIKMQKPTALAIKDQVSVEADEKLRQVALESTTKKSSDNKSKSNSVNRILHN